MKIDILGTKYDLRFIDSPDETMEYTKGCGYTDKTSKKIVVLKYKQNTPADNENCEAETMNTLIHEIIHAYLFESGIDYGMAFHNEDMVTWLATQFPKIEETIKKYLEPLSRKERGFYIVCR